MVGESIGVGTVSAIAAPIGSEKTNGKMTIQPWALAYYMVRWIMAYSCRHCFCPQSYFSERFMCAAQTECEWPVGLCMNA